MAATSTYSSKPDSHFSFECSRRHSSFLGFIKSFSSPPYRAVLPVLSQFLFGPVREKLLPQHPDEVGAIPPCLFSISKTGGSDRAPNGVGRAAKSIMGQPKLIFGRPAALLQGVW